MNDVQVFKEQEKALIDMQVATAKAYPREITASLNEALAIVNMDTEIAASCTYSIPRGNKPVTGPSVHLAKILAQSWGNMRVEARVVDISHTQITSQAVAFDIEKNLAIKVEVKRSIIGKQGRFNDDMITVTGNAANAIALRNAILAVIPKQVIDTVYKAAQAKLTGDIDTDEKLDERRKLLVGRIIENYKVTEEEVAKAVGKPIVAYIDRDDMVTLIGIIQAIKDGDTTIDEAFRKKPATKQTADKVAHDKESFRVFDHIESSTTIEELEKVKELVSSYDLQEIYESKLQELENGTDDQLAGVQVQVSPVANPDEEGEG